MERSIKNINIPSGTKDIALDEAKFYTDIEKRLVRTYIKNGFNEIRTPTLEYYDVYDYEKQSINQENMYKLTDNNGRLLVLRPDNTMPVARVIATKLKHIGLPQKLYYNQNIYRINTGYSGRRSEIYQSGIEIIGADGLKNDLICISTAIEALESLGIPFKLEIGHVGYFNALLNELNLSEEQKKLARYYVDSKNATSLNLMNRSIRFDKIRQIPLLFGGAEVFESAEKLAGNNKIAQNTLEYVFELYRLLDDCGYSEHIMVDMGIVHKFDYYTGVVFGGYIEGGSEPVLTGGRYDNLLEHFGYAASATGFAVNICAVADVFKNKIKKVIPSKRVIIYFDIEVFTAAKQFKLQLEKDDVFCEYSCLNSLPDTIKYAKQNNIDSVASVTESGIELIEVSNND